jgi:hypothetical protein
VSRAKLVDANLSGAHLFRSDLSGADLSYARLDSANITEADLGSANLQHATLKGTHLSGANLGGAYLYGANLEGADLRDADLGRTCLNSAVLKRAVLRGANLRDASLSQADLSEADLQETLLLNSSFEGANLAGSRVYGVSAWGVRLEGALQANLIITAPLEPTITVDNLEVAQFIYLLLNNEKIRSIIDTITTKAVLILGRFTPERKAVLDAIRVALRQRNYVPVLFDSDVPASRDTHETVTTLARLARFIIADITDPKSIPQELVSVVESLPSVPVQPLLKSGSQPWGMYDHIRRYPWVLELYQYEDVSDLLASLQIGVIAPAEAKAREQASK